MARSFRNRVIATLVLTIAVAARIGVRRRISAAPRQAGRFSPHQALYELSLVKSRGSNAINSARGPHPL